jgi:hypothetical protein
MKNANCPFMGLGSFCIAGFCGAPGWPALKPFGLRAPAEADFIQLSKIWCGERLI